MSNNDDPTDVPRWQLAAIMVVTAVVLLGTWLGYHVAFGRLQGAEGFW